jgi:hypothetical protein
MVFPMSRPQLFQKELCRNALHVYFFFRDLGIPNKLAPDS